MLTSGELIKHVKKFLTWYRMNLPTFRFSIVKNTGDIMTAINMFRMQYDV